MSERVFDKIVVFIFLQIFEHLSGFVGHCAFTENSENWRKMKISEIASAHSQIIGFMKLHLKFQKDISKTRDKTTRQTLKVSEKLIK